MKPGNKAIIIDFGSQVTQLIARRIREAGVYSEIHSCHKSVKEIAALEPGAIILSGGPASVLDSGSPQLDPEILDLGIPVLGICYGMQILAKTLGGKLEKEAKREYGPAMFSMSQGSPLWHDLDRAIATQVWMSHGDRVVELPKGFKTIGHTETVEIAAMADNDRKIYGLQFHPEVYHTVDGQQIIGNFLFQIANLVPDWNMTAFTQTTIAELKNKIGDGHVICALSGGVDSTVVAVLLHQAIGQRLHCIFVDNGLLRLDEAERVTQTLKTHFDLNLVTVDAKQTFLQKLKDVSDPEQKRKIVGHTFIEIFDKEASKLPQVSFLAQGTLYPDIIESVSANGPSAVIKSHHNVGGLPEHMKLTLIEPLKELFKDEVRKVAVELAIPDEIVWRQPFPGPGLAIRVLGSIDEQKLNILRKADFIIQEEMRIWDMANKVWQCFGVLLPISSVGVMGDMRTYENALAIRCVDSVDAMTADWTRLPYDLLAKISSRIINEVKGINRVVYDISSKPPSTIEWE